MMQHRNSWSIVLLCLASVVASISNARGQQVFQWKFTEGDVWKVVMALDVTSELNGKSLHSNQELTLQWTIQSVLEDGTAEIEQSVQRIVLREGDLIILDAFDPEPQAKDTPAAKRLRALLNVRFVAQTSARGKILDVRFEPSVLEWLRENLGLDESAARQMLAQENLYFPSQPIEVGETWTTTSQSPVQGVGMVKNVTTFQYIGPETVAGTKLDKFKVLPSFQLDDKAREMMRQEGSGTIWFDRELGRIAVVDSVQEFELRKGESDQPVAQKTVVKTTMRFTNRNAKK